MLPGKYAICDRCQGRGHHGNPSFDGTTTDWWLEGDPDGDDLDDYMSGRWDVPCEERCDHGKVIVPDEEACTPEQIEAWHDWQREEYEYRALVAAERRMGRSSNQLTTERSP